MSNSGNVSLNVQVVGQDEVSAMLAQIAKQAKKTEADLKAVGDADITPETSGISKTTTALGNTVEAVDKAEEKFNKLVGAIGFVSAAFAAATTVYTFIKGLLGTKSAVDATIVSMQKLVDVNKELRDTLDQIAVRRAPNDAAKEAVELAQEQRDLVEQQLKLLTTRTANEVNLHKLQKERKDLAAEIAEKEKFSSDNLLGFQTNQLEVIASKKYLIELDKLIAKTGGELAKSKGGEARLAAEIVALEYDRNKALRESGEIIEENKRKYSEFLYRLTFGAMGIAPALSPEEKKPKIPTGIASSKTTPSDLEVLMEPWTKAIGKKYGINQQEWATRRVNLRIDWDANFEKAQKASDERLDKEEKARLELAEKLAKDEQDVFDKAYLDAQIAGFSELADTVDKASSSFDGFARSVIAAADAFPELGDAMGGINQAMQKHAQQVAKDKDRIAKGELTAAEATVNAEQSRTQAIIEGSTAGLGAIAKLIGGKKAEYAIRAAGEVAMGFATLTNPVESAGHFVAAGLFAAAAGTSAPSGGGAGGGAGATQETPSSSSMGYDQGGGGQRTVVYNFSTLIADRQQVGRAIRDSELVGQRNGYGRRRGV